MTWLPDDFTHPVHVPLPAPPGPAGSGPAAAGPDAPAPAALTALTAPAPGPSGGLHLRPIAGADTEIDYPAVMGSRERLWAVYGEAWGWPPADMTVEDDRRDLLRHEAEIAAHESFNYALFDEEETALLGCVYIDPPEKAGADAEISWWVVDARVGTGTERALDAFVPRWIADVWPFERPRFVGRDLSWQEWLALPDAPK